jgi:hypothetical protein
MTFLHWSLLPLAAFAVVPILLHLLTLHRLRTVELSTYRFLFDSYVQQRRQMKFLEALLAFLRTFFLLALVLLFCRPVVRHWNRFFGGGTARDVVLLVDGSASMNARTAGRTALDRAKSAAMAVAGQLGKDDRLTLVRVGATAAEVFSRFSTDAEAIRGKIEAIESSPARANFLAAFTQVLGSRQSRGTVPSIYVFTDNQFCSWREVKEQGLDRVIPRGAKISVVHVGTDSPIDNRGVVGEPPRREQIIRGLPVRLRPRVVNHSASEPADVTVGVVIDGNEVARVPFSVQPGGAATKELIYTPATAGVLRGRFEIPTDHFPDDDSFLFALQVVPQIKVLVVNGYPSGDPLQDEALYVRTALSSATEEDQSDERSAGRDLGPSREFVRSLAVREIREGDIGEWSLHEAGVVLLLNCGGLNDGHCQLLRDFVRSGGGLVIFPGDRVNADAYNQHFFPVPHQPAESLTGMLLGAPQGDPSARETMVRLTSIDYAHPALSVFNDPDRRYLTTASFLRRFPFKPVEPRGASWPLARFGDGAIALAENHFGAGIVILAGFPASTKWGSLPLLPEFVPLLLRLVSYVAQAPDLLVPSTVPAEGAAEIAVAGTWAPARAKVVDPKGAETAVDLERSASRLVGQFDQLATKGYYAVEAHGGRPDPPQTAGTAFAVNTEPDESNFATARESQIRGWLPGAELAFVNASSEAQQSFGSLGEDREIWAPLILVLFAVIGLEFFLATMSSHGPEQAPPRSLGERFREVITGAWVGRMTGAEYQRD